MKKVLLVEDDNVILMMVKFTLELEGYIVCTEQTGQDAIKTLKSKKFDIVILDIGLPDVNGFQILQFIKTDDSLKYTKVIIFTGYNEYENMAFNLGCDAYINKPFSVTKFLDIIEKVSNK